jgi:hypothetical protein
VPVDDTRLPWFEVPQRPGLVTTTWPRVASVAVGVLVIWFVVTTFTGAPGPGVLHRFPAADLHAFADDINADEINGRTGGCEASVGLAASRVVVEVPVRSVDDRDRRLSECAAVVAPIIESRPDRFHPDMVSAEVVVQPSYCDQTTCE